LIGKNPQRSPYGVDGRKGGEQEKGHYSTPWGNQGSGPRQIGSAMWHYALLHRPRLTSRKRCKQVEGFTRSMKKSPDPVVCIARTVTGLLKFGFFGECTASTGKVRWQRSRVWLQVRVSQAGEVHNCAEAKWTSRKEVNLKGGGPRLNVKSDEAKEKEREHGGACST